MLIEAHENYITREVAEYLRISNPKVIDLIKQGKLKGFKIGKSYTILGRSVIDFRNKISEE